MNNTTEFEIEKSIASVILGALSGDGKAPEIGGLSLYKQSYKKLRYSTFFSRENGQVILLDQDKMRYDRMRKSVKAWADEITGNGGKLKMLTLTYRGLNDWKQRDITEFIRQVKKDLGSNLLGYCWVAEVQKRGALHYHVILWIEKGIPIGYPDKMGWWKHGSTRVTTAKSPFYILTYTGKEYQKEFSKFPKGARCHAVKLCDKGKDQKVKYSKLRDIEKLVVDSAGWEALKHWKEKRISKWKYTGTYRELELAKRAVGLQS